MLARKKTPKLRAYLIVCDSRGKYGTRKTDTLVVEKLCVDLLGLATHQNIAQGNVCGQAQRTWSPSWLVGYKMRRQCGHKQEFLSYMKAVYAILPWGGSTCDSRGV